MPCEEHSQILYHDAKEMSKTIGAPNNCLLDAHISRLQNYAGKKKAEANFPDPVEIIKIMMRNRGMSNNDLKPYIGSSGNVCDILNRRRPLTLRMIRNLHVGLGLPADLLIRTYKCRKP